jgi:D-cysteine desulfhydrase
MELPASIRPANRREPLIFSEFPSLRERIPWMALAHTPTRVERMTALASQLGRDDLWMKRDDLASPLYGGNKVRRYEHVLAEAIARGSRRIVTAGGLASTQVTATALFGHALGLGVRAVLFDQPITSFARQGVLANVTAGAELIYGGGYVRTTVRTARAYRREPDNYLILPGAANALANLGYIDAMLELAAQVSRGEMPRPDAIILPTGSSGTLAALAIGASYLGWDTEILGVRITARVACNRFTIGLIANSTQRFLAHRAPEFSRRKLRSLNYTLLHGALGRGYGYPTPEAVTAVQWMKTLTGAPGEVTYSGKALAALRSIAHQPRYKNKTILYWHTLSTPRAPIADDAIDRVPDSLRFMFEGDVAV